MKLKQDAVAVMLVISIFLLNSCATILNPSQTTLNIVTNKPSKLIVNGQDTLQDIGTSKYIKVNRNKKELKLIVFTDSLTKTVHLSSFNSASYWANLGFYYGLGMLVDRNNPKRYGYPKIVYLSFDDHSENYSNFIPIGAKEDKYSNIIKWTPLKLTTFINSSFELSYERRTSSIFSTQVMISYLLPENIVDAGQQFKPHVKGFRAALEERFYFKKSAPFGPYFALEFDYLKNRYSHSGDFLLGTVSYGDEVDIEKQNYSLNFKIGYQVIVKQLAFDFYAGLGLRYKDVKHYNKINPDGELESPRFLSSFLITNREGKYSGISMPLNARIGWTFK